MWFNSHFPNGIALSLHINLGRTDIFTMLSFPIYDHGESESEGHSVVSDSLRPMDYTVHGIFQARILGPFPSPRDLPNPGIEPSRQILYQLSHKGSPRIMRWVAYSFSSRSSQLWNRTRVSCIAGDFFFFFNQLSYGGSP